MRTRTAASILAVLSLLQGAQSLEPGTPLNKRLIVARRTASQELIASVRQAQRSAA